MEKNKIIQILVISLLLITNFAYSSNDVAKSILGEDAKETSEDIAKSILGEDAKEVEESSEEIAKSILGKDGTPIDYNEYKSIGNESENTSNFVTIIILSLIILILLGVYFYKKR